MHCGLNLQTKSYITPAWSSPLLIPNINKTPIPETSSTCLPEQSFCNPSSAFPAQNHDKDRDAPLLQSSLPCLSESPVKESPKLRVPLAVHINSERCSASRSFFYFLFKFHGKGGPHTTSFHQRYPCEERCQFPEPSSICLSESLMNKVS